VGQSVLGYLPDEVAGDPGVFGVGTAVGVVATMSEASDMVTDGDVGDFAADLGDIAREIAARDGTGFADCVAV
jgi:hypothetical protein